MTFMNQPGDVCDSYYEGEWQNNRRNGHGTHQYGNGDLYVGQFIDAKRHGEGKMTYKAQPGDISESFYDGQWANDNKEGQGKLQLGDGTLQDGNFEDNTFVGLDSDTV